MSAKHYKVQFGNAKAEQVDEAGLASLKARFGTRFSEFEVSEVAAPVAKPVDITKSETADTKSEGKKAKAE